MSDLKSPGSLPGNPFDSKAILDGIRRRVEVETPTAAPEQVNRLATMVADGYRDLPATIERVAGRDGRGDHLVARSAWGQDQPGILVLSHFDTVHPIGFIKRLPFHIEGDSAFGPGIYDMKGGAYLAYHAFRQICAAPERSPLGVTQLYVSDEEIGSPTSRALIEAEGHKAKYVLVTEPARDGGKVVTGRKGVARFEIFIKGVPSHAGIPPQDGRSAIRELGNVIQTLEGMNDPEHARTLAAEIGFDLVDTRTSGGSDGNFTAPHTATIDGLGVDGKGAHTHYEQMYISSIEPRARLLHRLYQTLQ
ncbi:MAG: M20/M25/M40 family metallo-hydrolase [Bradyrhizobium sp.]|uniref:M20/M25/M40 family metallo-hydrolase n=1 Tax=Bradyrhizobium sp. TaxID=376 RepID=UPI001C281A72|nr:M20/M25/M40 family metallo-hydrolase [Bradyrhizobium sp.]MBU6464739.1 M20/M25/M40 family metallo-hydrolase [Pseudomonadota bacterium]MDE2065687.1 M20/M25/M40 family metallo-hydrolase [Bradyrhizobium sp.]MDE2243623.1 M20/M25/M40 family metallo-hydrolase [Bradyrhizobium sp.]